MVNIAGTMTKYGIGGIVLPFVLIKAIYTIMIATGASW